MTGKGKEVALRTDPIVIEPLAEHTATVIFLHGLGDTPEILFGPIEHWRGNGQVDHVKFVLPYAPVISFTAKGGEYMSAWFDMKVYNGSLDALQSDEDVAGIFAGRDYIQSLITDEIGAGTPAERILLAGFSQGGVVAALAGLTYPESLAGIVLLSAWLPLIDSFGGYIPEEDANKETPIFLGHGVEDRVVTPELAKKSRDALAGMGFAISWDVYPGLGHATCEDELDDVEAFIDEQLS
ncbi:Phospholipase/carboxylesterase/thioesterase [Trichoderma longibrachiatum]